MLEIDAVLALVFLVVVVGGVVIASGRRRSGGPPELPANTELARVLDRILAVDEAFPQLPTKLRDEAKRITRTYYRELDE